MTLCLFSSLIHQGNDWTTYILKKSCTGPKYFKLFHDLYPTADCWQLRPLELPSLWLSRKLSLWPWIKAALIEFFSHLEAAAHAVNNIWHDSTSWSCYNESVSNISIHLELSLAFLAHFTLWVRAPIMFQCVTEESFCMLLPQLCLLELLQLVAAVKQNLQSFKVAQITV